MGRLLFINISQLITNAGAEAKKGVGVDSNDLGVIEDGALLWHHTRGIEWLGRTKDVPNAIKKQTPIRKLRDKILCPALVDSHTHFVFAGSRHREFAQRLEGKTYAQIAASGGGIKSSVAAVRESKESEIFSAAHHRLHAAQKQGTGIFEIKSGYGLDLKSEIKLLEVIRRLKKANPQLLIQSTFLGAHAFPPEADTEEKKSGYVDKLVDKFLPEVAKKKLADACDVFFDEGYFNRAQTKRILEKAKSLGMKVKVHADELSNAGGAALAAELDALSADHLLRADDAGLKAMAKKNVTAVLLPGTAFYLGLPYADYKRMKSLGVCVALATDFNPGSCPSFNLPFMMTLGCTQMGMTMPEAFIAATYGGAKALGMHSKQGFLRAGMKPKMAVFNAPSFEALISNFAHPGLCEELFG